MPSVGLVVGTSVGMTCAEIYNIWDFFRGKDTVVRTRNTRQGAYTTPGRTVWYLMVVQDLCIRYPSPLSFCVGVAAKESRGK